MAGIALASTITAMTMFGSVLAYARFFHKETRESFTTEELERYSIWTNWWDYFKLGVPSAFIYWIEMVSIQGLQVLAVLFGSVAQQNFGFIYSILYVVVQFGYGSQQAMTIIVGNLIGANQVALAKKMAIYALLQLVVIGGMISFALFIYRDEILRIFSEGYDIDVSIARECMLLVALINLIIAYFSYLIGCCRALGIQAVGVPIAMFFSLAEIPMGMLFSWHYNMRVWGLIFTYALSFSLQSLILTAILTIWTDWQSIADKVQVYIRSEVGRGNTSSTKGSNNTSGSRENRNEDDG